MKLKLFICMSLAFSIQSVDAHGGGLDSSGCHHDRKRGGYHCHRSSYTSWKHLKEITLGLSLNKLSASSVGNSHVHSFCRLSPFQLLRVEASLPSAVSATGDPYIPSLKSRAL